MTGLLLSSDQKLFCCRLFFTWQCTSHASSSVGILSYSTRESAVVSLNLWYRWTAKHSYFQVQKESDGDKKKRAFQKVVVTIVPGVNDTYAWSWWEQCAAADQHAKRCCTEMSRIGRRWSPIFGPLPNLMAPAVHLRAVKGSFFSPYRCGSAGGGEAHSFEPCRRHKTHLWWVHSVQLLLSF